MIAAASEILRLDGLYAYKHLPIKVLFACEHLSYTRQGMVCTVGKAEETLVDLLRSL